MPIKQADIIGPTMLNFALVGCGRIAKRHSELLGHKQIANARQRKTLEKLRDTLLPKLISGEVRVSY